MKTLVRTLVAAVLSVALVAPASASLSGIWEIETKDSRYDVTMCGDGTELCAELIWLGNGGDTAKNRPYLNTLLIDQARPVGPNKWKGELNLFGQTASGTITRLGEDTVRIQGCVLFVVCKSYKLHRYVE